MTLSALELLIAPHDLAAFLERWWEREPLFIKRREVGRFNGLITRSIFDDLVAHTNLRLPFFRLFKDGALVPDAACTTSRQVGANTYGGLADLNALYDGFGGGATIVLVALEKARPALRQLCSELGSLLKGPIQADAYLAPPDARGPRAHYDTHDVFVLQVEGCNRWRIWSNPWPLSVPMNEDAYGHEAVARFTENNAPVMEVLLEPGDTLYLPRGFVHAAETDSTSSLDLSISIMVVRWLDVFERAVHRALASLKHDAEAQRAFAFGRPLSGPATPQDDASVAALATRLIADLDANEILALAKSSAVASRSGSRSGALIARLQSENALPPDRRQL